MNQKTWTKTIRFMAPDGLIALCRAMTQIFSFLVKFRFYV